MVSAWALFVPAQEMRPARHINLAARAGVGRLVRYATTRPTVLFAIKLVLAALFLLIIAAGLYGTPIAERNAATVLTWNLWWSGLIVAVFFVGSAWCGVCPWDTLATWLVRRRPWGRADPNNSLNLRVPKQLRSVWPALLLFIGLTWLELGVGVTVSPYATALLALAMVVLATVSLALFERKAFCRYFCPVGRTVGFYSELAPVELRPVDAGVCARCTTLECFHGTDKVEPCPTHLVMGRLTQNTYCTSCGNCTQSCPSGNVAWHLRSPNAEAAQDARPHWDEAWFILALLALAGFHGLTMIPLWESWISALARLLGDSGRLLWSFTIGLSVSLAVPVLLYSAAVWLTRRLSRAAPSFESLFSRLVFVALPLAFAYHLAHNLGHLVRESDGVGKVLINPLGVDALPLSRMELHMRHTGLMIPEQLLFALQTGLMLWGFWVAVLVLRHRGRGLFGEGRGLVGWSLVPMLIFVAGMTGGGVGLLMQDMVMRL